MALAKGISLSLQLSLREIELRGGLASEGGATRPDKRVGLHRA